MPYENNIHTGPTHLNQIYVFLLACVKLLKQRTLLESQLNENKCVLDELNLLGPENKVYKLYGPILVKQELEESRQNVGKRIEYISKELKSSTDTLESVEKDITKHREAVQKLQQQYQLATAMK